MKKLWPNYRVLSSALLLSALLLCTTDYNPFDSANARVRIVAAAFDDQDSVPIFTPYWFDIGIAVRDAIDSIHLSATGNRHFTDTALYPPYEADTPRFPISLHDTGWQTITVIAWPDGLAPRTREVRVYAYSPLAQSPITDAWRGENAHLATEPVGDEDVLYHWQLGKQHIVSAFADTVAAVQSIVADSAGALWVSDIEGAHASPRTPFRVIVRDTLGPAISCVTATTPGGDTAVSAGDFMALTFHIADQTPDPVDSASVNGQPFDIVNPRERLYTRLFENLSQRAATAPLEIDVRAMDAREFGNWTSRRFWVVYDSAAEAASSFRLTVISPGEDSVTSGRRVYPVFGVVGDYGREFATVSLTVNDSAYGSRRVRCDDADAWSWEAAMDRVVNTLAIVARNDSGALLARRDMTLFYDRNIADVSRPVIWDIRFNGASIIGEPFTEDSAGELEIIAFDEGSGIDSVAVNRSPARAVSGAYRWSAALDGLAHLRAGNQVIIELMDRTGNYFDTTVTLFRNRAPRITRKLALPYRLVAGSIYVDSIRAVDRDGDALSLHPMEPMPATMELIPRGGGAWLVAWRPAATDTGSLSLSFYCTDSYQSSSASASEHYVVPADEKDRFVRFATSPDDFDSPITAGRDSLTVVLAPQSGRGRAPFRYSVYLDDVRPLINGSPRGRLAWRPALADTGWHTITAILQDALQDADTLYARVLVIAPNRPCSFTYTFSGGVRDDGALDLSRAAGRDTLFCTIVDPDSVYDDMGERLSARVRYGSIDYAHELDAANSFAIVLDPARRASGVDSLHITVGDKQGPCGAAPIALYYGAPPAIPFGLRPAPGARIDSAALTLSWECADPDGNALSYDLYFGLAATPTPIAADLGASTYRLTNITHSGRYVWRVVAHDGKDSSMSAWSSVYVRNPSHVRFATDESAFPAWLQAGADTMHVALSLAAGTGAGPFRFVTRLGDSVVVDTAAPVAIFAPSTGHIGVRPLSVIVSDFHGNSDTLHPAVAVVSPNANPVSISARIEADTTDSGWLDMSGATGAATITYTIADMDHPATERYDIAVERGSAVERLTIDSAGTFEITLAPGAGNGGLDTIRAMVRDQTGTADTVETLVYWGPLSFTGPAGVSGLVMWLRADTGVTLSGESLVKWADISGAGGEAIGKTDNGILPQYDPSQGWAGGKPTVAFDDDDDVRSWVDCGDIGVDAGTDDYSVIIVRRNSWFVASDATMYSLSGAARSAQTYFEYAGGGRVAVSYEAASIVSAVQGSRLSIYENGTLEKDVSVARTPGGNGRFVLSKNTVSASPDYYEGEIAEVLVYNRALSPAEVFAVENYLSGRYGIALDGQALPGSVFYINTTATGAPISTDMTAVPVAVRLDQTNFDFGAAGADGAGVRVMAEDRSALPFSIEHWDAVTQEAVLWVRVPSILADNATQHFAVYVDGADMTAGGNSGQVFPATDGYRGVYQMTGSDMIMVDASSANRSGYFLGPNAAAGCLNGARRFSGDDYGYEESFAWPPQHAGFTVSAWINLADTTLFQIRYAGILTHGLSNNKYSVYLRRVDSGYHVAVRLGGDGHNFLSAQSFGLALGTWYHVGVSFDGQRQEAAFYLNGRPLGAALSATSSAPASYGDLAIGREELDDYFVGDLDEIEIIEGPKSADWFLFNYEHQKPASAVISTR